MPRLLLVLLAFCSPTNFTLAKDSPPKDTALRIYIQGQAKPTVVPPGDPILPLRVYVKYFPKLKAWLFTRTNERSTFAVPAEVFQEGTVLTGLQLGSSDILAHYQLSGKGEWKETKEDLQEFIRVDANPPYVKRIYPTRKLSMDQVPLAPPPKIKMDFK